MQKDCWEHTGNNVEIQLQVQKTVPRIREQVVGGVVTSCSVQRYSCQFLTGPLPLSGHHPQFHLYSNYFGNYIHSVYDQYCRRHVVLSRETDDPRLSCPWWLETVQWAGCVSYPGPVQCLILTGGILSTHSPWGHNHYVLSLWADWARPVPLVIRVLCVSITKQQVRSCCLPPPSRQNSRGKGS